jgi:hypothetical protein
MSKLSRRSLVESAAALPALAVPAVAVAAIEPDPIFAAVETHKRTLIEQWRVSRVNGSTADDDPRHVETSAAEAAALEINDDAEKALGEIVPTTMPGVIALLGYIEDHCHQKLELPDDPENWHSDSETSWFAGDCPTWADEDIIDRCYGTPVELPRGFWLMRNALNALRTLAVQS